MNSIRRLATDRDGALDGVPRAITIRAESLSSSPSAESVPLSVCLSVPSRLTVGFDVQSAAWLNLEMVPREG